VHGCSIGTNISSDRELLVDIVVVVKGQSELFEVVLRLKPPCIQSGLQHELDDHCGQQQAASRENGTADQLPTGGVESLPGDLYITI